MRFRLIPILFIVVMITASCAPAGRTDVVGITITHDGKTDSLSVPENNTVSDALTLAGLSLSALDRVEPDKSTVVTNGLNIKVIRVTETFVVEQTVLPFESQTIKNESLTAGQTILIQAGRNGAQSITYRVVSEDGVEISRTVTKTEVVQAAQPEIIMVGVASTFRSVEISGVIAYISSSNAWLMESNTGNRRSLVSTGDLDGRIFSISPDRKWLLFSRSNTGNNVNIINTLWIVSLTDSNPQPIALRDDDKPVMNVVHYAEWVPGKAQMIAYSTVEPRSTAPGWQANNDLQVLRFNDSGGSMEHKVIIGSNPGGLYGWWGTIYAWSPDASEIAYARPDGIGLVDSKTGSLNPLVEITPYNTQGDWAWVPGISWNENHSILFLVLPASSDSVNTQFDLNAFTLGQSDLIDIRQDVGMFAYPVVSPLDDSKNYRVAYLAAAIPDQSDTSRYALRVMDRDGSNDKKLYPDEGVQGLDAQQVIWSPDPKSDNNEVIAFIAQGNMMFINPTSGAINQITGDGSINRIDWK